MIELAATFAILTAQREYLVEVVSPVVEMPGTAEEIAAKGRACISQRLAAGTTTSDLILSDDGTTIVARSVWKYSERFVPWEIRSRFVFEAREGRFRITQTSLERFNEYGGGWGAIGKWRGSGWERAQQAFQDGAASVATCVQSQRQDDW